MLKISEEKDIEIALCHLPKLKEPFKVRFIQTGDIITNWNDFVTKYYKLWDSVRDNCTWME